MAFKDTELGLVRLRAFGMFNIRIIQPLLFINSLIGTMANFTTADIEEYLSKVIVSRFNDYMGDNLDTILNLPGKYEAWAQGLQKSMTIHPLNLQAHKKSPAYHLEFTPGLCPNCGWDLKGETDSLVLHCSNCMSFWLIYHLRKVFRRFCLYSWVFVPKKKKPGIF